MNQKIGIALITCNAVEKLIQSSATIPALEHFVIVNDGKPYDPSVYPANAHVIQHDRNYSVGKSKNDAFKYLMSKGCEHIFIMEDDVLITNSDVFEQYIRASEISGIYHLNFALQGPHNKKQPREMLYEEKNGFEKLVNKIAGKKILASQKKEITFSERNKLQSNSSPDPRMVVKYSPEVSLAFYTHCVGAFSYYRREVLEKAGLMDERFINAWEHIEHTYRIIKAGYHPPFWWFPDLANSLNFLDNIPNAIENSTIGNNPDWGKNVKEGEKYFIEKTGLSPGEIPVTKKKEVKKILKDLKLKLKIE
jgi:GT2 family glycosyltransferase